MFCQKDVTDDAHDTGHWLAATKICFMNIFIQACSPMLVTMQDSTNLYKSCIVYTVNQK